MLHIVDSDDEIGPPLPPGFQMPSSSGSQVVEDSGLDEEDDYDDFGDEGVRAFVRRSVMACLYYNNCQLLKSATFTFCSCIF